MGVADWPRNEVVVLGEPESLAPEWVDRAALSEHVQRMVVETLAQVPPGHRLVGTELEHDPASNRMVLVSTWEAE